MTILGPTNLPSTVPRDASHMYAKNVAAFLALITEEGRIVLDDAGRDRQGNARDPRGRDRQQTGSSGAIEGVRDV